MSPSAATRSGPALRSGLRGPAAGSGAGAYRGTPLGRRGRGCPPRGALGWGSAALPAARAVAAVAGKKTVTGSALPATSAAPVLGDGPELVTVGVREAEQRPLLRSLFRRGPRPAFGGSRSLSSPLGGGARPLPGVLLASRFRGGDGLGVCCSLVPVWRPLPGPWVRSQPGCAVPAFCLFPECLWLLLFSLPSPPPPAQCLGLVTRRVAPPPCPG